MTGNWEAPRSTRRIPAWAWPLGGTLVLALAVQIARAPEEPGLPGLPVEVVEEPVVPVASPTPASGPIPDPSDRWIPVPTGPAPLSGDVPGVWTGSELVVWTGAQGMAWSPDLGRWRAMAPAPGPGPFVGWSAAWTGSQVLYLTVRRDGEGMRAVLLGYDPATDAWTERAAPPLAARSGPSTAWDGQRLHVWSGFGFEDGGALLDDGASYDLATDTWRLMPAAPLAPRLDAVAVWLAETGELVVWGGTDDGLRQLVDGAAYRPADGSWRRLPDAPWTYTLPPATTADDRHLYAWGLPEDGLHLPDGMVYDALTDMWQPLPDLLAQERAGGSATLTDDGLLVVWGGLDRRLEHPRRDGFVLDLGSERWRQIPPAPVGHQGAAVTWVSTSGAEGLLVWGAEAGGALYPGPPLDARDSGPRPASR